jgi:enoyl-CoA hydratase/carnithine racemase
VKPVSYELRGTTAILTIERPERRNAVDVITAGELLAGLQRFEADDDARVMILTGAGEEAFCAGADLKALAEAGAAGVPEETIAQVAGRPEGPMGFTRLTATKPTIAAISGWCLAGGLELALWCDLRIATRGTRLGYPERRWGVPLIDGGTLRLPRIVGLGRALDLILTGRIIETDEALDWGLLTEVVDEGAHLDRAIEIAEGLGRFPQPTLRSDRRSAIEGSTLPLEESLAFEAALGLESVATGIKGAARFASGEGRGGAGAGV